MDREDEAQELPAGGGEENEEAVNSQGNSQEEGMIGEGSDDGESDEEGKTIPKDFWITELPDPEDTEFRKYTHRTPVEGTHDPSIYEPVDGRCSIWESHPNHECYSSFGDGGTTAIVNAFGQLMQFSTYLGPGKSGMFSVDHKSISEPYFVWNRAKQLNDMSRACNRDGMTYGVYFPDLILEDNLVRKYVHCRWPRYEYESEKVKLVNQWMVHDGVVLQRWRFNNLGTEEISTKIVFSKDMLIRDVQYQKWDTFNSFMFTNNDHFLGPGSYSWICLQVLSEDVSTNTGETRPMDNSIGVLVSVFIDEIKQTREIVVAYKLVYSTSEISNDWKQFLVEADKANVDKLLLKEFKSTQYRPISLFSLGESNVSPRESIAWDKINSNLDFIFQRHLEHLLTVCAIPITSYLGSNDTSAVALTCGDISAHRICTSASLILANGEPRHANERPRNILTDTAFQIIKAGEFAEHYSKDPGKNEWQLARQFVGLVYKNWITHLDELDGRGKFAWPRSRRGEFGVFRLDDHVWAIRALKIAESMVSPNSLEGDIPERTTGASTRPTKSALAKEYSFANTQREVVQRFTTQNPNYQSKKRMLAVTRFVRESRFLFHARDIALFYNVDQVKWRGTQFIELLKNTIDSQPHHVDNEESGWDNTLRYALAIIMGTDGYKINAKSSFELVQSSIDVLFGSFSSNGVVPGQLDKDTKEQALFEDEEYADSYYHASFEIPYILLQYASRIHSLYKTQLSETTTSGPSATVQLMTDLDNPQHTEPQRREGIFDTTIVSIPANEQNQPAKVADAMRAPANLTMKKTTPFNELIDITNIVDRDDEWLYNYPSIFSRKVKLDLKEAEKSAKAGVNYSEIGNGIVRKELDNWERNLPNLLARWNHCFVVDIQQTKSFGRSDERNYKVLPRNDNRGLWEKLSIPRTPEQAKKRLTWMPLVREFQAFLCYLATPENYQIYQHILHVAEEELESAIGVIGKWEKREDDRKGEEPRWTRNDEMKYHGMINKFKGSTKRRVMDLHVAYRNIKTLRETIENSQDQIRNDLSLQGSENIRFFTYVTVVFPPLGFATGIFSMSGAPDGKVLGSMAVCAVVALLLTVLPLLNAKQLAKIVDDLFSVYHRYSQAKMERSLLVKGKKERRSIPEDIEGAEQNHNRVERTANSHDKKRKMSPRVETWTLLFWIHYFKFMVFQLAPSPEPTQDSDEKYKERLNMLIHPPDVARPIKPLIKKLKARRENEELEKKSKKKNGHEERAPDNENNYV
ncbi:hypothetical protein BOTNAR_0216g00050 [Botryotinia narcissicola]|uniref:Uncharacterized protein n=1 Tax=Botryotinia narcissicola TaxID=278944 RepID=A0A4Z1ICR7_9HELO|nr:hypothetical protein BOTNAR_0216g00050 [Botryotinia narcissicola]